MLIALNVADKTQNTPLIDKANNMQVVIINRANNITPTFNLFFAVT